MAMTCAAMELPFHRRNDFEVSTSKLLINASETAMRSHHVPLQFPVYSLLSWLISSILTHRLSFYLFGKFIPLLSAIPSGDPIGDRFLAISVKPAASYLSVSDEAIPPYLRMPAYAC